jgi:hypothetical protein
MGLNSPRVTYSNSIANFNSEINITLPLDKIDINDLIIINISLIRLGGSGDKLPLIKYSKKLAQQSTSPGGISAVYAIRADKKVLKSLNDYKLANGSDEPLYDRTLWTTASINVVKHAVLRSRFTTQQQSRLGLTSLTQSMFQQTEAVGSLRALTFLFFHLSGNDPTTLGSFSTAFQRQSSIVRNGFGSLSSSLDTLVSTQGLNEAITYTIPAARNIGTIAVYLIQADEFKPKSYLELSNINSNNPFINQTSNTTPQVERTRALVVETQINTANLVPRYPFDFKLDDIFLVLRINANAPNASNMPNFTQISNGTAFNNAGTVIGSDYLYAQKELFYWDLSFRSIPLNISASPGVQPENYFNTELTNDDIHLTALIRNTAGTVAANFLEGTPIVNHSFSAGTVAEPIWQESPQVDKIEMDTSFQTILAFGVKSKPPGELAANAFEETQIYKMPNSTTKGVKVSGGLNPNPRLFLTSGIAYYEGIEKRTLPDHSFAFTDSIYGSTSFNLESELKPVLKDTYNSWSLILKINGAGSQL